MRKFAFTMPVFALIMGAAGYLLRKRELATVFEEGSGLAMKNSPVSIMLIVLSAFAVIIFFAFAVFASRNFEARPRYEKTFAIKSLVSYFITVLIGAIITAAAVKYCIDLLSAGEVPTVLSILFAGGAVLSGISIIAMAYSAYKGKYISSLPLLSVISPAFLCIWLVMTYKENAANPVILDYCYIYLALAASVLAFYFSAGFVFGKSRAGAAAFCMLSASYLCIVSLADDMNVLKLVILAGFAVTELFMAGRLLANMSAKSIKRQKR